MPLSEHEQKMLEQMENALANEDPRFASHMRGTPVHPVRRKRLLIGAVALVAGLGLLVLGIQTTLWVGAAGFAVMVAGVAYALSPVKTEADLKVVGVDGQIRTRTKAAGAGRGGRGPDARPGAAGRGGKKRGGGFMDRMDQRWERRQNDW